MGKFQAIIAGLLASMSGIQYAAAQTPVTTLETQAYPTSQDGKRIGCSVSFKALISDNINRDGAYTMVSGSFAFMRYPGKVPALTSKLVLRDVSEDGKSLIETTGAPATVSIVGADDESNIGSVVTSQPGETPGSRITAYKVDDSAASIFKRMVSTGQIVFLFNRKAGGTDIRLPIDLMVEDAGPPVKRDGTTRLEFAKCVQGLIATE